MSEDYLRLLTGGDIPLHFLGLPLHQPRLKEIGHIGEESFFMGLELLVNMTTDQLEIEDKSSLDGVSDFQIILRLVDGDSPNAVKGKLGVKSVLTLIFGGLRPVIQSGQIDVVDETGAEVATINDMNFPLLREKMKEVFPFASMGNKEKKYNPAGDMSEQIAKKLEERHKKLAELKKEAGSEELGFTVLGRYVSILSVELKIPMTHLSEYTSYQLLDNFNRYLLCYRADLQMRVRMAGGEVKEEDHVDHLKDIRNDRDSKEE